MIYNPPKIIAGANVTLTPASGILPASIAAAGGGGGAVNLISEVVTAGSQANVQFAAIVNTYRDLIVRFRGRGTTAAASVALRIRFNNDSGANYDFQEFAMQNNSGAGFPAVANTSGFFGTVCAANATANFADMAQMVIGNYTGTVFQKPAIYQNSFRTSSVVANIGVEVGACWWRSTAAINQIDIFPSAGAFVDGSVVSLYGSL
jgi:hypothetical protein